MVENKPYPHRENDVNSFDSQPSKLKTLYVFTHIGGCAFDFGETVICPACT